MTLETKLSRLFLLLGAGVGIGAVALGALDLRINLPDWMVQVAMIKLAVLGAGGLLVAGAVLGRHARRNSLAVREAASLPPGDLPADFGARREQVVNVKRPE